MLKSRPEFTPETSKFFLKERQSAHMFLGTRNTCMAFPVAAIAPHFFENRIQRFVSYSFCQGNIGRLAQGNALRTGSTMRVEADVAGLYPAAGPPLRFNEAGSNTTDQRSRFDHPRSNLAGSTTTDQRSRFNHPVANAPPLLVRGGELFPGLPS